MVTRKIRLLCPGEKTILEIEGEIETVERFVEQYFYERASDMKLPPYGTQTYVAKDFESMKYIEKAWKNMKK